MPKPYGTYTRVQRQQGTRQVAEDTKQSVRVAERENLNEFYRTLDKVSESELGEWHRSMAALAKEIEKNGAVAKQDRVRKKMSKVVGEVRKLLEKYQNYTKLEGKTRAHVEVVIRQPQPQLGTPGDVLALSIALLKVLEFLILIRKRR